MQEVHSLYLSQVAHLFYNRYEPRAMIIHLSALVVFPVLLILFLPGFGGNIYGVYSYFIYISAVSSSTIFYRLSPLHPLSRYPGPVLARISKLWMLNVVRSGRRHVVLKQLHDRYGPHVRIGKSKVVIRLPLPFVELACRSKRAIFLRCRCYTARHGHRRHCEGTQYVLLSLRLHRLYKSFFP